MKRIDGSRLVNTLIWLVVCASAIAAYWWATDTGIGISPDSTAYLATARYWLEPLNVAPLRGPSSGTTYSGPLYPASLAVASVVVQQDPGDAARWLNLLVLPINLLLVGVVLRRAVPSSTHLPWIGALLFLTAPDLMTVHTMAWSEPMFLALVLLGVCVLDTCLQPTARAGARIGLAAIAAAACLQRLAGVALVVTVGVAIVLWSGGSFRRRLMSAAFVGAVAFLPAFTWAQGHPGFQARAYHPVDMEWLRAWWPVLARWVVPYGVPMSEPVRERMAFLFLAFGALLVFAHRAAPGTMSAPDQRGSRMAAILGIFACAYIVVLCVAASFWDALVVPDGRLFTPLWMSLMLLILVGVRRMVQRATLPSSTILRVLRLAAVVVAAAWVCATVLEARNWLVRTHQLGQGYNSREWRESPTILAVGALPAGTFLVSGGNDAITAVTGRPARRLPDKQNPATRLSNTRYDAELEAVRQQLIARDGVVVFFDRLGRERPYIPAEDDLLREWRLRLVVRTKDGALYWVDSSVDQSRSADSGSL